MIYPRKPARSRALAPNSKRNSSREPPNPIGNTFKCCDHLQSQISHQANKTLRNYNDITTCYNAVTELSIHSQTQSVKLFLKKIYLTKKPNMIQIPQECSDSLNRKQDISILQLLCPLGTLICSFEQKCRYLTKIVQKLYYYSNGGK